jgi:hypothetical protein
VAVGVRSITITQLLISSEDIMNRFEAKVVIVTGARSGIGADTARRFLREGVLATRQDRDKVPRNDSFNHLSSMGLHGFTANKDANMSDDSSVNPPSGDISSDKADRMRDFFARHGGPSGDPIHHVETERGTSGWSETYAKDGYALRCDWSRVGGKEEMQFAELRRPPHR